MLFDFALAQSIFSHCGLDLIADPGCLRSPSRSRRPECWQPPSWRVEKDNTKTGWIYPGCVTYQPATMARLAREAGLRFEVLDWRHPTQTWTLFAAPKFDLTSVPGQATNMEHEIGQPHGQAMTRKGCSQNPYWPGTLD